MITKFRRASKLSKKLVNEKLNANKFDLNNRKQRKAFLDAIE